MDQLTWSREEAIEQRKCAVRFLLDTQQDQFTRSLEWIPQQRFNVPLGIWTLLYEEELVDWYEAGGDRFCLTVSGWIEACRLLSDEVGLDLRFGRLSAHLKSLTANRTESWAITTTDDIAEKTGLTELWVSDAIDGNMAEVIYHQHGARLTGRMVEVPAHLGNPL